MENINLLERMEKAIETPMAETDLTVLSMAAHKTSMDLRGVLIALKGQLGKIDNDWINHNLAEIETGLQKVIEATKLLSDDVDYIPDLVKLGETCNEREARYGEVYLTPDERQLADGPWRLRYVGR